VERGKRADMEFYEEAINMSDKEIKEILEEKQTLSADFIINYFPDVNEIYVGLKNPKITATIFTHSRDKAYSVFMNIMNDRKDKLQFYDKDHLYLHYENGDRYCWWNLVPSIMCCCNKAYIDIDITKYEFTTLVYPLCFYCSKHDITII